jgi:hypothetical protein
MFFGKKFIIAGKSKEYDNKTSSYRGILIICNANEK